MPVNIENIDFYYSDINNEFLLCIVRYKSGRITKYKDFRKIPNTVYRFMTDSNTKVRFSYWGNKRISEYYTISNLNILNTK